MRIANPIYDVVFKYLMEDNKVAKLIISSIIRQEINQLDFLPKESAIQSNKPSMTVYHLDSIAKIKTPEGMKTVFIELLKAKFYTDITRFREYLGKQLAKQEETRELSQAQRIYRYNYPIVSIYFLGNPLQNLTSPVVKVAYNCYNGHTNDLIVANDPFMESLTPETYIIQIPYLKKKSRYELETLLSVFDQSAVSPDSKRFLDIDENDYPPKYQDVIFRLLKAQAEPRILDTMAMEDDIVE